MTVTRTHFTFRIDTWTPDGENIVEHIAGVEDYHLALPASTLMLPGLPSSDSNCACSNSISSPCLRYCSASAMPAPSRVSLLPSRGHAHCRSHDRIAAAWMIGDAWRSLWHLVTYITSASRSQTSSTAAKG